MPSTTRTSLALALVGAVSTSTVEAQLPFNAGGSVPQSFYGNGPPQRFAAFAAGGSRDLRTAAVAACESQLLQCNLGFDPLALGATLESLQNAGERPSADLIEDMRALKDCMKSMVEELNAIDVIPINDPCVDALQALASNRPERPDRPSICPDGSKPMCADGSRPQFDRSTRSLICADQSPPLCADGSVPNLPQRGPGGRGPGGNGGPRPDRPSICPDESKPMCADGSRPQFDRSTRSLMCADGSSPLCEDGSVPTLPQRGPGGSGPGGRGPGGRGPGGNGGPRPDRPSVCPDESKPSCVDGGRPQFDRSTRSLICADGSSPLCEDGSVPTLPQRGPGFGGDFGGASNPNLPPRMQAFQQQQPPAFENLMSSGEWPQPRQFQAQWPSNPQQQQQQWPFAQQGRPQPGQFQSQFQGQRPQFMG